MARCGSTGTAVQFKISFNELAALTKNLLTSRKFIRSLSFNKRASSCRFPSTAWTKAACNLSLWINGSCIRKRFPNTLNKRRKLLPLLVIKAESVSGARFCIIWAYPIAHLSERSFNFSKMGLTQMRGIMPENMREKIQA